MRGRKAKFQHGGRRPGAGRPKKPNAGVSHLPRPGLSRHTPVHVTLRTVSRTWNLRSKRAFRVLRRAMHAGRERFGFRLVHYSVQGNHMHLVAEAQNRRSLSRGLQGLTIRMAKALNRLMSRKGRVFRDRYHARVCRTARDVRGVLLYVLNNRRRHAAQFGERLPPNWVDEFSSAGTFRGWNTKPATARDRFAHLPVATVDASCELLRIGWRRYGPLQLSAIPGPRAEPLLG